MKEPLIDFGEIALEKGYISHAQLQECRKISESTNTPIAKVLVDKGYLKDEQSNVLSETQDKTAVEKGLSDKTENLDSLIVAHSEYIKTGELLEKDGSLVLEEESSSEYESSFFGSITIEMGFAKSGEIQKCVQEQAERMQKGRNQRLGDIAVELGVLKPEQISQILSLQGAAAVVCPNCGATYDPAKLPQGERWRCNKCNNTIEIPVSPRSEKDKKEITDRAKKLREEYIQTRKKTGERSFGDYMLMGKIAQGGMGIIYKAKQKSLNRIVALKVLISGEHASQEMIDRFMLEGRVVARLKHPNIVPIFDMGVLGGRHFFAMDFIHGESLRHVLIHQEKVPLLRALEWTRKVASALDMAHEQNIIHRDVKPENILIDETGEPQVTDFGLAKDVELDSGMTQAGLIMGTPAYMSPEQVSGDRELVDRRSDVYALGSVMYEMLTGEKVIDFKEGSGLSDLLKLIMEDPVQPRKLNRSIPGEVETICLKALDKDPDRRYQTAKGLEEDINRYLAGEPIKARPASLSYKLMKKIKRNKAVTAAVLSALIFIALTAAYFVNRQINEQRARANQVQDFLLKAKTAVENQNYDSAVSFYTRTLGLEEDNMEAHLGLQRARDEQTREAELRRKRLRTEQALDISNQASEQLKSAGELLKDPKERKQAKKLLYETIGLFDKALSLDQECLAARKGKFESAEALGLVSLEDKDFGVAVLMFSLAEAMRIDDERAKKNLARAENARMKAEQIDKFIEEARVQTAQGQWESAIHSYELALKSEALKPDLRRELEQSIKEVKYMKSYSLAEKRIAEGDRQGALDSLLDAQSHKTTEDADKRIRHLRYLISMEKARTVRKQGNLLEALTYYEEARSNAQTPEDIDVEISACRSEGYDAAMNQAAFLAQEKKWERAAEYARKALVFRENDSKAKHLENEYKLVSQCPENMAYLLSSEYKLGSIEPDDHNPERTEKIGMFFIDKFEVANEDYREFMAAGGYGDESLWNAEGFKLVGGFIDRTGKTGPATWEHGSFPIGKDDCPVTGISWYEASAYAKWAGKRLPSKDEWELAASWEPQTGKKMVFPWGDEWNMEAGNFASGEPAPVGRFSKDRSPLGCFDMGGNAFEWTASKLYEGYHVIESGTYGLSESSLRRLARAAKRKSMNTAARYSNIGFRCALTPKGDSKDKEK